MVAMDDDTVSSPRADKFFLLLVSESLIVVYVDHYGLIDCKLIISEPRVMLVVSLGCDLSEARQARLAFVER